MISVYRIELAYEIIKTDIERFELERLIMFGMYNNTKD